MKRLLLLLLFSTPLAAQETDLRELLRDALYAEEVDRDPAAAATQYEDLLARFRDQRAIAATALFRLAEVRRKQDRKNEAITLYQRLLAEFPEAGAEAKLARENLAALGAKPPAAGTPPSDGESLELARLTKLAETSPDLLKDPRLLLTAAVDNQLRVMRFLIEQGADPNAVLIKKSTGKPPDSPLLLAASEGHLSACKLLLEAGADPNLDLDKNRPLVEAAIQGHGQVVALLLEHGADPDFAANGGSLGFVVGTALAQALRCGHPGIAALLVEAGAEVNPPTEPFLQTALHVAAGQGDAGVVKLLLEAGADPQATITRPDHWARSTNSEIKTGTTPLVMAVEARSADCIRLLITADKTGAHGVALRRAVELNSRELVELLLDSGTDPNALDSKGEPALAAAVELNSRELIELLLARGADPNLPFGLLSFDPGPGCDDPFAEPSDQRVEVPNFVLYEASRDDYLFPAFKTLLAAGARPNPVALADMIRSVAQWDEDGSVVAKLLEFRPDHFNPAEIPPMAPWQPAARREFLQQVVYPALAARSEIAFLFFDSGKTRPLAEQSDSPEAPALARLLLDHSGFVTAPGAHTGRNTAAWSELQLIRADASGRWTEQPIDLAGDDPFPELRWGDIITADPMEEGQPGHIDGDTARMRFDWAFRKRISFPITVEIDGKAREITLNGGLLVYDPTRDEAPLLDAHLLTQMLAPSLQQKPNSLIRRSGWDDIRVLDNSEILTDIPLQAGDVLAIETRGPAIRRYGKSNDSTKFAHCYFTVPGFPVLRSFGETYLAHQPGDWRQVEPATPTLIQAIVDTYAPWSVTLDSGEKQPSAALLAKLSKEQATRQLVLPTIPSHPDFGHIRIRRWAEDGSESILEVDLAAAIARCSDETPDQEARAADIPLLPNDIVELPLHQDRLGQPWNGFSPAETRFFRKALGGWIQFFEPDEQPRRIQLSWHPPRWHAGPAGLLPLAPESGPATMRASEVIPGFSEFVIDRDGNRSPKKPGRVLFLRDGDQVHASSSPRMLRPPAPQSSPTRVRRVPTPPSR